MRAREQWIFPGMPVLALLRARPAALKPLEVWGIDPWLDPHARLEALAAAKHIPWTKFEAGLVELPASDCERAWNSESIPDLLDCLVADHRDILGRLVPAIRNALSRAPSAHADPLAGPDGGWNGFVSDLEEHIREEENFLFPRLLHYAYCLRHHGRHPDFDGGSVNVYIAIRLLGNEHRQMDALRRFMAGREALAPGPEEESPAREKLAELLAEFQERLERHNHVEEHVLYPKARDLEKSLYDSAIAGAAASRSPSPSP